MLSRRKLIFTSFPCMVAYDGRAVGHTAFLCIKAGNLDLVFSSYSLLLTTKPNQTI